MAAAVAGRDGERAKQWAAEHGVERAVTGYQALIDDPDIDALYIPLPNSLHAEWTIKALRAGKPMLCEKPLCGTLAETEQVLAVARETGTLLWEAFVFPFNEQMDRVRSLLADGAIGELREIQSDFHFLMTKPEQHQAVGRPGRRRAARRRLLPGPARAGAVRRSTRPRGRPGTRRRRRGRGDPGHPGLPRRPAAAAVLRDAPRA